MLPCDLSHHSSEINLISHDKAKFNGSKCLEFVCFILLVDKISFSFLRVSLIYGSQRPKPFLWFRPKTNTISKNGCKFWADTETNQNQQIQVKEHFFKSNIVLKFDVR